MTSPSITELRNQLLVNGYSPIPNIDKMCVLTGWPTVEITPEAVSKWSRSKAYQATGIRIENGLAAIDLDINNDIINDVADRIFDAIPILAEYETSFAVRKGKGFKEAWFVRTSEPFGRIHSIKWVAPGENKDEHGTHCVEIFGGSSARQFGAYGPHSHNDDGSVAVEYSWPNDSLLDVPLHGLPELTKEQFYLIRDIVDEVLRNAGWTQVETSKAGEGDARWAHDLTEDMVFNCNDGRSRTLAELVNAEITGLRCSASFIEGPECRNTTRCLIGATSNGELFVWDTAEDVRHTAYKEEAPDRTIPQDKLTRMFERLDSAKAVRRHKPNGEDDAMQVATKIAATYAFCAQSKEAVIPIYDPAAATTVTAFRQYMLPYCETEIGPRGGEKKINPADIWMASTDRVNVRGIRMRPDQYNGKSPLYEEDGVKWVNSYRPPLHDATGGECETFREFMRHLLSEPEEHDWFMQWLAYKFQNPQVPGCAVIFVAQEQGTGRGTLFEILAKLFGPDYATTLPFADLTGKNSQSQFNSWQATSLIACVNESAETETGISEYKQRIATYEHLKELVDPRQQRRSIKEKFEKEMKTVSYVSILIATNHSDALPITDDDRRFAVLRSHTKLKLGPNGLQNRINDWMKDPANVAELARYLHNYDVSAYDPYDEPIQTDAKRAMAQSSKSDLDEAIRDAMASLNEVFTMDHVLRLVNEWKIINDVDLPDNASNIVRKLIAKKYDRVGETDGTNWKPTIFDKRRAVYAKTYADAKHWRLRHDLKDRVEENGAFNEQAAKLKASLRNLKIVK